MAADNTPGGKGKTAKSEAPDDACECRSGPLAGAARVSGATFRNRWLNYADVDGEAIFEGDIVLGRTADIQADLAHADMQPQFSIGITGAQFRWPGGLIPYEIDPALPNQQRITDPIAHWQANTPIRFALRNAGNPAHANFVRFVPGGGCSSMVGMRGGQQNITLGAGCTTGNTIHEIGHAVGLWHEQSREDRNNFITVVWANIDPAMQHNFSQHISDGDDLGNYDFGSLMHYPATAFSVNGQATIVPRVALPPGVVMGQRSGLSAGDIAGVRAMYPGLGVTIKEVRKDAVADPTLKEIRKDPIQDPITIKEVRKDPVTDPTVKEIRKDPIRDPVTLKEAALDPGPIGPFPRQPGQFDAGATPFILAGGSRYAAQDPLTQAAEQVQQLAEAHTQAQEQADALAQAYEQAVQTLQAMQQGGVA